MPLCSISRGCAPNPGVGLRTYPAKRKWTNQYDFGSEPKGPTYGGVVYALLADMVLATKVVQTGKHCNVSVRTFDKADKIVASSREKMPVFIVLDWDAREAEAYKLLLELGRDDNLKKIPTVGFCSQSKAAIREEAQRAGCDRVYFKAEFIRQLSDLFVRYVP